MVRLGASLAGVFSQCKAVTVVFPSLVIFFNKVSVRKCPTFGDVPMILLSNVQVALAYNEAVVDGRITEGGIIQSMFLESLMKRVGDIFAELPNLKDNLHHYLTTGRWPDVQNDVVILSWYLQWYSIPPPHVVASAVEKIRPRVPAGVSMLPLLRLLLPTTHLVGLMEIEKFQTTMKA